MLPTGPGKSSNHSIDNILGIKASLVASSQQQASYSGSDSSSTSEDPDTSPSFPLENSASDQPVLATITQGELNFSASKNFINNNVFSYSFASVSS
jgi:hypothetical protein